MIFRFTIKSGLSFCFENIQSIFQILKIIYEAIKDSKGLQNKLNIFYLINDLIYNAKNINILNSWIVKDALEVYLPDIIPLLNKVYQY